MNRPEQTLQQACVRWFDLQYPKHKQRLFAINNNAKNARQGGINKSMGVRAGVADMCLITDTYVVFIEFKTGSQRQSKEQKDFEKVCKDFNQWYFVIKNVDEFIKLIETYIDYQTI